jgi:hypothetical protein
MSFPVPHVRVAEGVAYVSFDNDRSWWAVRPDGTTVCRFRMPLFATVLGTERGCPHIECTHCTQEDG